MQFLFGSDFDRKSSFLLIVAASVDESINLSCSTEYKDYTYNTKQDIWTLVSLKAPLQEEDESDEKRPPVDVVAVIDISGSMSGGKLALIKKTLEYFLTQCKSFLNLTETLLQ